MAIYLFHTVLFNQHVDRGEYFYLISLWLLVRFTYPVVTNYTVGRPSLPLYYIDSRVF